MSEKTCNRCGKSLPLTAFEVRMKGKRRGTCTPCRGGAGEGAVQKPPPAPPTAASVMGEMRQRRAESDLRARVEVLGQENDRLNKLLETMRAVKPAQPVVFTAPKVEKGESVPLWDASDWHVEELVDSGKIQGLNHYDLAEAEKRSKKFFQNGLRLTHMAARESKIRKMLLVFGGDFFSNSIHEELMETNQLGPTQAVQFATDLLTSGIRHILTESDLNIEIACVVGNHGRITKKLRFATAIENNLEYLMYQWVASMFKDEPRVKFHICPGTMQFVNLFDDYLIRIVHGYEIKSGGGIGGITIPIRKKLAGWDEAKQAKLTIIHHFHQMLDGGNFLVNGSLIGYNEYCQANGFSPEHPQQTFALIHSRNGGEKTLVAPIWVTEARK